MIKRFRNRYHVQLRTGFNGPVITVKLSVDPPDQENLTAWVKEWARINPSVRVFGFDAKILGAERVGKKDKLS